jgi:hypothetical protein
MNFWLRYSLTERKKYLLNLRARKHKFFENAKLPSHNSPLADRRDSNHETFKTVTFGKNAIAYEFISLRPYFFLNSCFTIKDRTPTQKI